MTRVFVYGSCVSRDPFDLSNNFDLVNYFARSSIGSAFCERPVGIDLLDVERLSSPFQRRMVASDLDKSLGGLIGDGDFDVLLLDFIDERMSTAEFGGSTITVSPELLATGYVPDPSLIHAPWSDVGLHRRYEGIQRIKDLVRTTKIVVNKVYWSTHDSDGRAYPSQPWVQKNNKLLDDLYNYIGANSNVQFVNYPDGMLIADASHKWGSQPYHYAKEANEHLLSELQKLT